MFQTLTRLFKKPESLTPTPWYPEPVEVAQVPNDPDEDNSQLDKLVDYLRTEKAFESVRMNAVSPERHTSVCESFMISAYGYLVTKLAREGVPLNSNEKATLSTLFNQAWLKRKEQIRFLIPISGETSRWFH